MLELQNQILVESLSDSFETMAFVSLSRRVAVRAPVDAVHVTIPFKSPTAGTIEMVTSRQLGRILTANILCAEPDDPEVQQHVDSTLKEMMNVFGGLTIRRLVAQSGTKGELGLPQIKSFDAPTDWEEFAKHACVVLVAEGNPIAIRICESESTWRSS